MLPRSEDNDVVVVFVVGRGLDRRVVTMLPYRFWYDRSFGYSLAPDADAAATEPSRRGGCSDADNAIDIDANGWWVEVDS